MSSHLVYDDEWIRVVNMRNKDFVPKDARCEVCLRLSVEVVWYNVRTKKVRCLKCFIPQHPK